MKILVAGDLHFQKEKFESLRKVLLDCDILCLTGDYLDDKLGDREGQIQWISKWVASISKPIVMCSGNHDLDQLAECDWIASLATKTVITDNSVWTFRNITFGVIPYIGAQYSKYQRCDVLVCHLPPSNTNTSREDGCDFGDEELYLSVIEGGLRPQYVFCGHVDKPDRNIDQVNDVKIVNASLRFYVIDF